MTEAVSISPELEEFFDYIWGTEEGYVYLALKNPSNNQFHQRFFEWPQQRTDVLNHVVEKRDSYEVYYGPSIYNEPKATKDSVKGSNVFWVELDGVHPTELNGLPEPTLRIRSSSETYEHWYWKSNSLLNPQTLERTNRSLTYYLGADSSGWDSSQILRPPDTFNHKRQKKVQKIFESALVVTPDLFTGLPNPPALIQTPIPNSIPPVEDVVARYKFDEKTWKLFREGAKNDRSAGLMALGYTLAEMQMNNEEILSVLINADKRWGKFSGRPDQLLRLSEIVTIARQKFPLLDTAGSEQLQSIGLLTLLKTKINLEWVWEGLLQKAGYLLLTGPSEIGKTQLALNAAFNMALGYNFLEEKVNGPLKVGFFSLEMGFADLKYFLEIQSKGYMPNEMEQLENNCRFFPLGEPLYLNRKAEKELIETVINEEKLDGVFIDSLGSATEEELSREGDVKNLMDWNDRLRNQLGVFTWIIHHHRKATADNKRPNKLSDVYGSQYITARATTVLCMWPTATPNSIDLLPLKIRLAKKPPPFALTRNERLQFFRKKDTLIAQTEEVKETPDSLIDNPFMEPEKEEPSNTDHLHGC